MQDDDRAGDDVASFSSLIHHHFRLLGTPLLISIMKMTKKMKKVVILFSFLSFFMLVVMRPQLPAPSVMDSRSPSFVHQQSKLTNAIPQVEFNQIIQKSFEIHFVTCKENRGTIQSIQHGRLELPTFSWRAPKRVPPPRYPSTWDSIRVLTFLQVKN